MPTLSAAMGLPIPFSNIGSLSPELLAVMAPAAPEGLALALYTNAMQVARYLAHYSCGLLITPVLEIRTDGPLLSSADVASSISHVSAAAQVCMESSNDESSGFVSTFPKDRMRFLFSELTKALDMHHLFLESGSNDDVFDVQRYYVSFLTEAQAMAR